MPSPAVWRLDVMNCPKSLVTTNTFVIKRFNPHFQSGTFSHKCGTAGESQRGRTQHLSARYVADSGWQRACAEQQPPDGLDHLLQVQAARDAELVLQGCPPVCDQEGQVRHGDRVDDKRGGVRGQIEAVLDPLLDRRPLRARRALLRLALLHLCWLFRRRRRSGLLRMHVRRTGGSM